MDDGGSGSSGILWFVVMLALEMIFYGFSAAMQNHRGVEKEDNGAGGEEAGEETGKQSKKQARLFYMTEHHAAYATATQLGVVTINLLLGAFILYRLSGYISFLISDQASVYIGPLSAWQLKAIVLVVPVLVTILLLYIIMTIGVMVPKKAAAKYPEKWIFALVTPFYYYVRIVSPFGRLIAATSRGILYLLGVRNADDKEDVTEEEILSMVSVGHEQGILHANEAEMITNIFEYGDKEARDIMINRNNLIAIDGTMTLQEAAAFIADAHNSRFPVYDETIDHIIGILHLKDVMRMQMNAKMRTRPIGKIKGLLREPRFITENRKINDLFQVMRKEKIQMVIVIDEYGQTAGLVALEDILEEIVGNIQDEYDEEADYIRASGADRYVIDGMMPLEELEERLQISFEGEPFDTVNGFVISRLEHIPEEGEDFEFSYGGYLFRIQEVKDRMIRSVTAVREKAPDKEEEYETLLTGKE
ncbi:MAG: hemolysin family protein [Bacteroidales bacterium]|nr:hemolysin family protein [Bacteroidales bacterium]MCM1416942.1 hemolysin family protein [bacterium]MCM1424135.1 hemolysin family protein [bacterium]